METVPVRPAAPLAPTPAPLAPLPEPGPRAPPPARKIALLLCLYFAQGLPYGFQVTALPLFLRVRGVSLQSLGFVGLLALPWMGKALWAPLVDRYQSTRYGRRRSWIVPMQAGLCLSSVAGVFAAAAGHLPALLALVFLMNLFAATQDIAVDGLAVDLLGDAELGPGNAAQVVGYKLGMLTSGGLLLWASGAIGWPGLFAAMAFLTWIVLIVSMSYREPPPTAAHYLPAERRSMKQVLVALLGAVKLPGTLWLLAFIGTYKIGETMLDVMLKPYLVDSGFAPAQLGLWLGTYGMVFSLVGSVVGGWLAARIPLIRAVGLTAALRVLPLFAVWGLTFAAPPSQLSVVLVTCAEHFFAGAVTTALFAFMMSRVDRRIGATHYTLLASVEVFGKSLGAWPSGFVAKHWGYGTVFLAASLLSVAYLALFWPRLARTSPPPPPAEVPQA